MVRQIAVVSKQALQQMPRLDAEVRRSAPLPASGAFARGVGRTAGDPSSPTFYIFLKSLDEHFESLSLNLLILGEQSP